jgi:hypothetical protein
VQITRHGYMPNPLTGEQVIKQIRKLKRAYVIADETESVTNQLARLLLDHPTGGKQIHDTNIVATMLINDIQLLLTMNYEDFARFENKITLRILTAVD